MADLPKPDIIQYCSDIPQEEALAAATKMASLYPENIPPVYSNFDIIQLARDDEDKMKGEHVFYMLPDHEIAKHLPEFMGQISGLAAYDYMITLCGFDKQGEPWFLYQIKIEQLMWLVELMEELEHAKFMNERYKRSFIGDTKRFPHGTYQWAFSQQVQQHHAAYLNTLDTLVSVAIEDDLNKCILTLPKTGVVGSEDRNRACQEAQSE